MPPAPAPTPHTPSSYEESIQTNCLDTKAGIRFQIADRRYAVLNRMPRSRLKLSTAVAMSPSVDDQSSQSDSVIRHLLHCHTVRFPLLFRFCIDDRHLTFIDQFIQRWRAHPRTIALSRSKLARLRFCTKIGENFPRLLARNRRLPPAAIPYKPESLSLTPDRIVQHVLTAFRLGLIQAFFHGRQLTNNDCQPAFGPAPRCYPAARSTPGSCPLMFRIIAKNSLSAPHYTCPAPAAWNPT